MVGGAFRKVPVMIKMIIGDFSSTKFINRVNCSMHLLTSNLSIKNIRNAAEEYNTERNLNSIGSISFNFSASFLLKVQE